METITIFQIFIPSDFICVTFLAFCSISFKRYSFYLLQFILLNHLFIFLLVFLSRAHFITHIFFSTLTLLHFAEPLTGWLVERRETFLSEILNSFFFFLVVCFYFFVNITRMEMGKKLYCQTLILFSTLLGSLSAYLICSANNCKEKSTHVLTHSLAKRCIHSVAHLHSYIFSRKSHRISNLLACFFFFAAASFFLLFLYFLFAFNRILISQH